MSRDEAPGIRLVAEWSVRHLSATFGGEVDPGALDRTVTRVVSPEHATSDRDLVVATSSRWVGAVAQAPGVVLCSVEVALRLAPGRRWVHPHATWALARLLGDGAERSVAPPAGRGHVDPGAEVDPSAVVRPGAVVLAGARVGADSVVGEGAVIHGGVRLGARVVVGPNAVVGHPGFGWALGPDGAVVRMPQLAGVVVEEDVEIGALSTVDAGTLGPTVLRRGVKLDAHVHVAHNVEVGPGTLVAAQAGFAGSVRVGAGVLVGGQAGVADHVVVGDGARLAAKAGVIGDVPAGAVVAGYPAVPRMAWLRAWARLLASGKTSR